jgi:hypothetical protein
MEELGGTEGRQETSLLQTLVSSWSFVLQVLKRDMQKEETPLKWKCFMPGKAEKKEAVFPFKTCFMSLLKGILLIKQPQC